MELSQEQAFAEIEALFGTMGWKVMAQMLLDHMIADTNAILSLKRPEGQNDDHLRGRIEMVKWIVAGIPKKIAEFKANKAFENAPTADPIAIGDPYHKEEQANPAIV